MVAGLATPQEEEKKRKYQQRVLDVEMGSFTRLVFATNGGMGADCNCFLKRLAEKLSEKNEEPFLFYLFIYFICHTNYKKYRKRRRRKKKRSGEET